MMDLGATVCTPRSPVCSQCPWASACAARAGRDPEAYPRKRAKKPRPTRHGMVFWLVDGDGRVALRRRPDNGLLGGMMEFPSTDWRPAPWSLTEAMECAAVAGDLARLDGAVGHTFTHFHLELGVLAGEVNDVALPDGWRFVAPEAFDNEALPTVMKKIAAFVGDSYAS